MKKLLKFSIIFMLLPGPRFGGNHMPSAAALFSALPGGASVRSKSIEWSLKVLPEDSDKPANSSPILSALFWMLNAFRMCFAGWSFFNHCAEKVEQFPSGATSATPLFRYLLSFIIGSVCIIADVVETGINGWALDAAEWLTEPQANHHTQVQ